MSVVGIVVLMLGAIVLFFGTIALASGAVLRLHETPPKTPNAAAFAELSLKAGAAALFLGAGLVMLGSVY